MTSIDIKTRYKFLKSPNVPFCLKACGDELIERAYLGQIKIIPECMSSIVSHAVEDRKLNANKIEELIGTLSTERKNLNSAQEDSRRIAECSKLSNHIIFAVLLEFLRRCRESSLVHLSYPRNGWLILGPPYSNNYEMVDESRFQKSLSILLDMIYDEFPLKRDMLCYTMSILSQMVQIANENFRSRPALSSMVRYQIASLFAPILIGIRCGKCKCNFTEASKPCDICSYIPGILHKPFEVDIMDRLLKHIPTQFWRNVLINIRNMPLTDESDEAIHKELTNYFLGVPSGKPKETVEKAIRATSTDIPEPRPTKPARKSGSESKKQSRNESKTTKPGKVGQDENEELPVPRLQTPSLRRSSMVASQDEVDEIKDEHNDGGDGEDDDENESGQEDNDEEQEDDKIGESDENIDKSSGRQKVGDGKANKKIESQTDKQNPAHTPKKERKSRETQSRTSKSEEKSRRSLSGTASSSGKVKVSAGANESGPRKRSDKAGQKRLSTKSNDQTRKSSSGKKLESKSKPGSNKRARSAKIPSRLSKSKH